MAARAACPLCRRTVDLAPRGAFLLFTLHTTGRRNSTECPNSGAVAKVGK